jgi:hypothetical protein
MKAVFLKTHVCYMRLSGRYGLLLGNEAAEQPRIEAKRCRQAIL